MKQNVQSKENQIRELRKQREKKIEREVKRLNELKAKQLEKKMMSEKRKREYEAKKEIEMKQEIESAEKNKLEVSLGEQPMNVKNACLPPVRENKSDSFSEIQGETQYQVVTIDSLAEKIEGHSSVLNKKILNRAGFFLDEEGEDPEYCSYWLDMIKSMLYSEDLSRPSNVGYYSKFGIFSIYSEQDNPEDYDHLTLAMMNLEHKLGKDNDLDHGLLESID